MSFTLLETAWEDAPRPAPPGTTLFAVGDVHGHASHLDALLAGLAEPVRDAKRRGDAVHLVLLGDYVDRGPSSLGTLDRLPEIAAELGVDVRLLRGNHDRLLADLLTSAKPDPEHLASWLRKGGAGVVRELGLEPPPAGRRSSSPATLIGAVRERLGATRLDLLGRLADSWQCGAWLFVHAGVDPVRSLKAQDHAAWLTMREPFLSGAKWAHDFAVVHGHTVRGPEVLPHRVAVDSGAYRTGVLTAAEIAGGRLRFRSVADRRNLASFRALPGSRQGRRFVTSALQAPASPARGGRVTAEDRTSTAAPSRPAGAFTSG